MRAFGLLLALGIFGGALADSAAAADSTGCPPGSWYLQPDDCICMNSTNGAILKSQTLTCCRALAYKTYNGICAVDHDNRQPFKDCCKDLDQTSVIGHCR